MDYRRPRVYIPPYNYCDRWCERCRIDKTRCLLYQTEMDERLHREIDGKGRPSPEEVMGRMVEDTHAALRLVEEQVRGMGFDPEELKRAAGRDPEPPAEPDPIVEEALVLASAAAAFVRQHAADLGEEAALLRRTLALVGPKLGRAQTRDRSDEAVADAILQAQVADRALAAMMESLEKVRVRRPGLSDGMLDLLALMQRMRVEIRRRWLERPCDLLEPAPSDAWWGPLRDITPTLRHLKR